jgi:RHS repeat-associated protein
MPATATVPAGAVETVAFDQVEVRKWGTGVGEVITTYPHPNIRLIWTRVGASTSVEAQALHRDQLGSVRAVTTFKPLPPGAAVSTLRREAAIYQPFGAQTEVLQTTQVNQEQKGWIGERYDADAGLQYLNARYYDPGWGFFLQPDWFEVTAAGVGTNRYSYSFNDPVNMRDPGGNEVGWFERQFYDAVNAFDAALDSIASDYDEGRLPDRIGRALTAATPGGQSFNNAVGAATAGNYGDAAIYAIGSLAEAATVVIPGAAAASRPRIAATSVARSEAAAINQTAAATTGSALVARVHGNSLQSTGTQALYNIITLEGGKVMKIGITEAEKLMTRYSADDLLDLNVDIVEAGRYSNRLIGLVVEKASVLGYMARNGGRMPPMQINFPKAHMPSR